ncbi:F-box protein At5g07610-like [Rhododendron vialii]|uniref:F-box protein At5g07610-like n=1 Tax=Rhododendron vialii TaxID=182163 RepID=UPI00265F3AF1|nr:F-box protein At5g07610-like [Rhododendron vialii]
MIGSATSKRTKRTKPITGAPSSEISPAAEIIANNVDLLTEILLRLRAKSLILFKSVSKHWFSLISNSQFSITLSRRNPNPSISSWFFSSMPPEHSTRPTITHSCNGLLLIRYPPTMHFLVFNPTIQKYRLIIPYPSIYSSGSNLVRLHAYLDFDPSKSPHYKVVLLIIYGCPTSFNVGIDIYSSGSMSWKQIHAHGNELIHAAFSGGVFYWFGDENMLVGFDVDSAKMIEMPNAPKIQRADRISIQYFGGCGGRLILILDPMVIKILEMDKNDGSWKIDCEVDLHLMSALLHQPKPYWNYDSSVLSVVKKEEGKGYELIVAFPREVFCGNVITYNLSYIMEFKVWTVVCEVVPGESICDTPPNTIVHPYIESLSPV